MSAATLSVDQRLRNKKRRLKGIEARRRPKAETPIVKQVVGVGRHFFNRNGEALLGGTNDALWLYKHEGVKGEAVQYRRVNGEWVEWSTVRTTCDCAA